MNHHDHSPMQAAALRIARARQSAEYLDRRASAIRTVGTQAAAMTVAELRRAGGLTKKLEDGAELLGFQILDHVIVAEDAYYSYREHAPHGERLVKGTS